MLTNEEADDLLRQLVAIHAQLDQFHALTRDIHERVESAKKGRIPLSHSVLTDLLAQLLKNKQDYYATAMRGVAIYDKVKAAGVANPKLDAWAETVRKHDKSMPD